MLLICDSCWSYVSLIIIGLWSIIPQSSADHSGTQGAVTNQARTHRTDDNNGTSGTETRSQTNAKLTINKTCVVVVVDDAMEG